MATRNVKVDSLASTVSKIILCGFFLLCTVVGTWKSFTLAVSADWREKAVFYLMAGLGLSLLVNFLTAMYFGGSKRRELAGDIYDQLYNVVNNLLIKSEAERLTTSEFTILTQLSNILGRLSKYCDVNIDVVNNRYERLKNSPPQYLTVNPPQTLYGAVQTYDSFLTQHQYPPAVANSGSAAVPPTYQNPPTP